MLYAFLTSLVCGITLVKSQLVECLCQPRANYTKQMKPKRNGNRETGMAGSQQNASMPSHLSPHGSVFGLYVASFHFICNFFHPVCRQRGFGSQPPGKLLQSKKKSERWCFYMLQRQALLYIYPRWPQRRNYSISNPEEKKKKREKKTCVCIFPDFQSSSLCLCQCSSAAIVLEHQGCKLARLLYV